MENERQEEKPQVQGGVSLFKILIIVSLIIIIGLLVYLYRIEYRNYDLINTDYYNPNNSEDEFYYKGIPDEVSGGDYYKDYINDEYESIDYGVSYDGEYTSQPKTMEYHMQRWEIDEEDKNYSDELNKKIEEFNAKYKNNILLSNIYTDSASRLAYTYELTNNNTEPIENIDLYVVFYDENGKIVSTENVYYDFIPASGTAYRVGIVGNLKYAKYDYLICKNYPRGVTEYPKDSIEYEVIPDDTEFAEYSVVVRNKSNTDMDALFRATYKDESGKIIHVEDSYIYLDKKSDVLDKVKDFVSGDDMSEYEDYKGTIGFTKDLFGENEYGGDPVPYKTCDIELISTYRYDDYDDQGDY